MGQKRGKIIVIDGIDGSGKTEQTNKLVARLEKEEYKVKTLDFPQYEANFFGKVVAGYLEGEFGNPVKIHPCLASIIYAVDRWESSTKLWDWLSVGNNVILDRYTTSNMGHQGSKIDDRTKRKEFLLWLEQMEYKTFKIPKPDLNILLHLQPEIAQMLIDRKSVRTYTAKSRDGHESSLEHLKKTLGCFLEIAHDNPSTWKVIYCTNNTKKDILPLDAIHEKVYAAVLPFLDK